MTELDWIDKLALTASVALPLCNVPLIINIIKRRSSRDISLVWVFGVWICILMMAPSGFRSEDIVWRTFNICNVVLFTAVVVVAFKYRKGHPAI